jgi:3-isopropylmalate/(R)-2-methylmalate dehydratase small subunit
MSTTIRGRVYVVGDNIDTDQIIPAEYLNLVPTIPDEYRKLGSYAMAGMPLPPDQPPFVPPGTMETPYRIIVGGKNFGCGSSREHAPIALGAAGAEAVVAESYARIFFRNCVATGELYPVETDDRLVDAFRTNDEAVIDLDAATITNTESGKTYRLRPLGDAGPVIAAGGLFAYARQTGMIPATSPVTVLDPGPSAGPED